MKSHRLHPWSVSECKRESEDHHSAQPEDAQLPKERAKQQVRQLVCEALLASTRLDDVSTGEVYVGSGKASSPLALNFVSAGGACDESFV